MSGTATAVKASLWPIAEDTLAACPHLAWTMIPDSPVRAATDEELARYAERNADPAGVLHDATAKAMAAPRPLRPAVAADEPCPPPPGCECSVCVPPELPGIGELDEGREEALRAYNEFHDAEDARTATLPGADADPTELVATVEPGCGETP